MSESRTLGVLLGAAVVVAALFAPWYALDLSGAARDAITQQTGQLPGPLGEVARGLLSAIPDRIVANGWQVFEKTDIVLLCCGLGAAFAALLQRLDVAALAGGAAAIMTVGVMLNRPGPEGAGAIVQMQWGPWVALAGALAIVVAARMRERAVPAAPPIDWSAQAVAEPLPRLGDGATSVAPPG